MARKLTHAITLLLALAAIPAARGEATLTLEQAVQEARQQNPRYLQMKAKVDEADAREFMAFSGYLPTLTGSAAVVPAYRFELFNLTSVFPGFPAIQAPTPIGIAVADFAWNFFDGFQTTNNYRAARLESEAARRDLAHAELQLDDLTRLRFYQALSARQLSDVSDENVKTLQDHLAKTQALLSHGATTKLDTLRVEVQLSESIPDQTQAHDNVALDRKALTEILGRDADDRPLTGQLPTPDEKQLPADLKLELAQRDDIQAAQERADAAAKRHLSSIGRWLPRVGFLGEVQTYNNNLGTTQLDPTNFNYGYSFTFNLSWDLFNGAGIGLIRETAAQQREAEYAAQAAVLQAPVDFETQRRRFLSNVELYRARAHAIESADESVRLARISYEAGTRTSTEVLDAELDLFRARAGVVRAKMDAAESLINLELAVGHPL